MKYSYKWLQELSGTKKSPQELADFLTMRAFEVEEIESVGCAIDRVVVAQIDAIEKHPNADKLRILTMNIGENEPLRIVCGAPDVEAGQKLPLALDGAELANGITIRPTEVRGVFSPGMVCGREELGIGEGLWVLPDNAPVGVLIKDFLNDADWLLDIKVLPDRAHDCLSHVGMAREIAALEGGELDYDYAGLRLNETISHEVHSSIKTKECRRHIGALVKNVVVKPSPAWLQNRLKKLGVRPINNIVDITNFVMLELGQPMHAFDWDTLDKERGETHVDVRFAWQGEIIRLLDGKDYLLDAKDLVIADSKKALDVAGIMGGADTAVRDETTTILFEAANFDPVCIRKTRSRLGLRTDASDRFEKGLDPNLAEKALVRALELLRHIVEGIEVEVRDVYPDPAIEQTIKLHPEKTESLLGVSVDTDRMVEILSRLGCEVKKKKEYLLVTVPTWRLDLTSAEDLIEEIGRGIGYDAVTAEAPRILLTGVRMDGARAFDRRLRDVLVDVGFTESYQYSFYSEREAEAARLPFSEHVRLSNPMSSDQALMRTVLSVGLLRSASENLKHTKQLRLFETGRVYAHADGGVNERKSIALLLIDEHDSFSVLKGVVEHVFETLGVVMEFDTAEEVSGLWHPTRTADIVTADGKQSIGRLGEIHPFVTEAFKIKKRVAYVEIDFEALFQSVPQTKTFVPMRKYPEVLRDISLYVPETVRVKDIVETIRKAGGSLVLQSELFDHYFDETKDMKSLAFHIHFGADDRTLEGQEVDTLLEDIVTTLTSELVVERR